MPDEPFVRLEADGLVAPEGDAWRTTRRWQGAMLRASARLMADGDAGDDLRVPVATALLDLYGERLGDDELAAMVTALGTLEARLMLPGPVL